MGYVLSFILLIIFIVIILILKNKHKKDLINLSNVTMRQLAADKIKELTEEYYKVEDYYKNEKKRLEEEYLKTTEYLEQYNEKISLVKKGIENELEEYKKQRFNDLICKLDEEERHAKSKINQEMNDYRAFREKMNNEFEEQMMAQQKLRKDELDLIIEEIKDYEKKREVINKQILMEREQKEKADFYRIVLSEFDQQDMKIISQFGEQLHNKEVLNRAIFDAFVKKPMNEMIKRVLEGKSPSGIYMITNLLTNEIYIGRAVSIDKRWQEHCKSCFNIGTIAHSTLHTRMAKEGIWNFSFQLLEEVPKDKLSEREKYWINFYKTKEYGLNEKAGG